MQIPPSDAKVFQDYVLPSLSLLPGDTEEAVRVAYASGLAHLSAAAHRHLMKLQYEANAVAISAAEGQPAADAAATIQRPDAELRVSPGGAAISDITVWLAIKTRRHK